MRAYNYKKGRTNIKDINMMAKLLGVHGPSDTDYIICNYGRKESTNYGRPFYYDIQEGIETIGTRRAYRVYFKEGCYDYWTNHNNEFFLYKNDVEQWVFNRMIVLKRGGVWDTFSGMWYSKKAFKKALRNHKKSETIDDLLDRVWSYQNR